LRSKRAQRHAPVVAEGKGRALWADVLAALWVLAVVGVYLYTFGLKLAALVAR